MALNTSGNWDPGDDQRVLRALQLPFGAYTLTCLQGCMHEMERISPEAVLEVKALLDAYDQASDKVTEGNLGDTEGKILTKADVLEWTPTGTGASGAVSEKNSIREEIRRYFAFCSCLGGMVNGTYASNLIRS